MQTVFSNSELPHIWANGAQHSGRNSGDTFYFSGDTIYSYGSHFAIAKHFYAENITLVNNNSYSITTAAHISKTINAIRGKYIEVNEPTANTKQAHRENYKQLLVEINDYQKKFVRARTNKDFCLSLIESLTANANEYSKIFKLGHKSIALQFSEDEIKKALKKEADKKKQEKAERLKKDKGYLTQWKKGEAVPILLYSYPVMLRVKGDDVETSHGAKFPKTHAPLAWRVVKNCVANKRAWQTNGKSIHLGHYQVDKIDINGNLKAGCHLVSYAEIERIAKELNL